jgi:hypothetical protein
MLLTFYLIFGVLAIALIFLGLFGDIPILVMVGAIFIFILAGLSVFGGGIEYQTGINTTTTINVTDNSTIENAKPVYSTWSDTNQFILAFILIVTAVALFGISMEML